MNERAAQWAEELRAWAVPPEILAAAPQEPYVFPPTMFAAPPAGGPRSRSSELAAEALGSGGSLLDVGCGGGAAAFAVTPPATSLIGTDRQADMLELFARTATDRGVPVEVVVGSWQDVADDVPVADVVVSHNVLYNVADPVPFAAALTSHARGRVVIEITESHPQTSRAPLWRHFWDLDRPDGPTAWLLADVLRDAGIDVRTERSSSTRRDEDRAADVEAAFWCRQLCLPQERAPEVAELVRDLAFPSERVALWWDVTS